MKFENLIMAWNQITMFLGKNMYRQVTSDITLLPWVQGEVAFQDSVQVLLLCGQVRYYLIDLSYDSSEERSSTKKQEDAKHLRGQAIVKVEEMSMCMLKQTRSPAELAEMSPATGHHIIPQLIGKLLNGR